MAKLDKNNIFYDPTLTKRHAKANLFKGLAVGALALSLIFLAIFLADMLTKGLPAFQQTYIKVDISFNEKSAKNYRKAVERKYVNLVSRAEIRDIPMMMKKDPSLMNTTQEMWILADDQVDMYVKGKYYKIRSKNLETLKELIEAGKVEKRFNSGLFMEGDSLIPEKSGLSSAIIGSIFTLFVTMLFAFPIGVATAVYLEEFADPDSKWSNLIEININNLAAIPSILFGLLGLSIFINIFGLPRSSPIVGGLTLALMTLPIIIVSSRAALRSVPASIRQAGYGLGLTKIQVVRDHVLPLAFPGVMTGSIIGLAQAMGETAPLIIVGMIAFIPDSPTSVFQAATVMPAQIFTWAGRPEIAYIERTAAGIIVLLSVLISLNALAVYLRKKYEVKWQ
jgi:phosphate transport system permease protein